MVHQRLDTSGASYPTIRCVLDRDWVDIGTSSSMGSLVSSITGVRDLNEFENACIAQKMSWASRRQTTRIEHQAYCLMDPFGVNMPPIRGS
jgi:hypothetical protein